MSTRIALVAVTFLFIVASIFAYLRGTDDPPTNTEAYSAAQSSDVANEASVGERGSLGEKAEVGVSVEQQFINDRAHTPEELIRYIDRMGTSYRDARKYLSQADVPALLAMLNDPRQSQRWLQIVVLLTYIDKEEESVDSLIAYIQRGEDWESLLHPNLRRAKLDKANAISKLGLIGGNGATDVLRLLFTEHGADQLLSEWIDDTKHGRAVPKDFIRGRAMLGLVYTQKAANIQLVEALYQSLLPQVRAIEQRPGHGNFRFKHETEEEHVQGLLYVQAVTALATRDFIESEGIEEYKSNLHNMSMIDNAIAGHAAKYFDDIKE